MTHQIYRYSNRKLYSRELSRFVTLQEVFSMAKLGTKIAVSDHTGNDITAKTLNKAMLTASFTTNEIVTAITTQGEV